MDVLTFFIVLLIVQVPVIVYLKAYKPKEREKVNVDLYRLKADILAMSDRRFEYFCADLFKKQGYQAYVTKATADGGKDIILNKGKEKIYVECKHFVEGSVSRPIANKLLGVMTADRINNGIIISTGKFTKECLEFCRKVNIECMGLDDIIRLCREGEGI